jgi:protein O-mannosyl-transferase
MSKRNKSFDNNKQARQARREGFAASWLRLRVPAGAAIIVLMAIFIYLPSINGGFVLDDNLLLTENHLIRTPDGLYRFWCTAEAQDYWPVINSTFWIEERLWEMNPTGYHVTNLILHILEALLIWIILRKLSIPGAFLAAMIFTVHPVNVESVAWIASRKNTMAMLFFLLSILWYLKGMRWALYDEQRAGENRPGEQQGAGVQGAGHFSDPAGIGQWATCGGKWYWLSLASFVLAMLSKGSAAVLPALLLGILWWLRSLTKQDLLRIAPFFVIAVSLTLVNIWFQTHGKDIEYRNAGFAERLLGAGGVVWFYLYKALLPFDLAFIYPTWRIEPGNPLWWLPLLSAIIVTAVLWLNRKGWSRPFLFAWGFFCASLVPVLGFTDVGFMKYSLVADHYQHIAIIGVIALVGAGWSIWHKRELSGGLHGLTTAAAVVVVGTLAFLTLRQNGLYRDAISLYAATLQKNPGCSVAHYNLGLALFDADRLHEAIEHYRQALDLKPNYVEAHNNLGLALVHSGRLQEAIEQFEQALSLNPDYADAHSNLGVALVQMGRHVDAIEHFERALRLKPDYAEARNNLGMAMANTGRLHEAIENYQQALRLNPDYADAHNNLGAVLLQTGRYEEAIEQFKQALANKPDFPNAYYNLGNAFFQEDRLPEAIEHYKQALRLKPDYAEAHYNLGMAMAKTGRLQEAIEHYRQTVVLDPGFTNAHINLALAYARIQKPAEAVAAAQKGMELALKQGQMAQAKQIEDWLKSYRAGLPQDPNAPSIPDAISPPAK